MVIAIGLVPSVAMAQEPRWEAEVYGGLVAGTSVSDNSRTLPPPGAPLVTSNPIFPTREVPSWFFGDGAALLNDVAEEFGATARVAPLDALFAAMPGTRTGAAGARIRRRLSPRMSAEFSVDWFPDAAATPVALADTVEAARASFTSTMREVLASGPFEGVVVEATASSTPGRRRDIAATAAVNADLGSFAGFTPYATFGGGVLTGAGTWASADLAARYEFSVLGEVPIEESGRMTARFERPAALLILAGGGLRRDLSDRWGARVDVRALTGPDTARIVVDTDTVSAQGTPAGFVESFTNPAIQFSNDPSTGRRSTLSAPPLQAFRVYSGGLRTRVVVTIAISRRF